MRSLLLVLLLPVVSFAQVCQIQPASVKQGDVVRLSCSAEVHTARTPRRTVPLFHEGDGRWEGLLPLSANDPADPVTVEFLSAAQQAVGTATLTVLDAHFPIENVNMAPSIANLHNTPDEVQLLKAFRENVSSTRFWSDEFLEPVGGCMVSPYGVKRYRNHKPTGEFHGGVDLRSAEGTPVRAAADGVVKFAQLITALGNAVGLDHGQAVETIYMHLSKLAVEPGAHVKQGDTIGYVGTTGRSNGPHLHWTVYVNSVQVNPAQWTKLTPCSSAADGSPAKGKSPSKPS